MSTGYSTTSFEGDQRFEVIRQVGAGGMGVVYEVFDRFRGERVAVKTLGSPAPEMLYYLKREFRSLTGVVHPNLVTLYELISTGGHWFITMEFVDGVDFLSHFRPRAVSTSTDPTPDAAATRTLLSPQSLASQSPVSPDDDQPASPLSAGRYQALRDAAIQLVQGVCGLHAAGKLHRDLKPSNVMVTPEGRVVILDFGLVTELVPSLLIPRAARRAGTAAFMAPEQGETTGTLTEAADWFAIGMMLYQVLTGCLPRTQRKAAPDAVIPPPSELVPEVPVDLDRLVTDLLQRDPALRPGGSDILERLGGGKLAQAAARRGPRVEYFSERRRELHAMRAAFQEVEEARPCVLYMHGPSGIGKTALASAFLQELARNGVVTIAGRCYERESLPFKALDNVMDALSRYLSTLESREVTELLPRNIHALARLFPMLYRVSAIATAPQQRLEIADQRELRRRASGALRELFGRLGDRRRVCIYIDDLQWGDEDSAELLRDLLAPPDPPLLLFLGAYRSDESPPGACVARLLAGTAGRSLEIAPLKEREALHLALGLLGQASPLAGRAEAIAHESGGNPYLIYELVRFAEERREGWSLPGDITLEDMLWNRAQQLPDGPRELLEVLAVAGHSLPEPVALEAAGISGEAQRMVALLRGERLVRTSGPADQESLEPFHDRIRETIAAHLPEEAQRRVHRRLAEAIGRSPSPDAEMLAMHYQGAGEDVLAAGYYQAAAEQAEQTLAFGHAADLYRTALDLAPPQGDALRRLQTRLADALANAGRSVDAARFYSDAAAQAPPAEVTELERRAAYQYSIGGKVEQGREAFRRVLKRAGMRLPDSPGQVMASYLWVRLVMALRGLRYRAKTESALTLAERNRADIAWSAGTGLGLIDVPNGAYFTSRALLVALQCGEPNRIARALVWEAVTTSVVGKSGKRRAEKLMRLCTRIVAELNTPYARAILAFGQGILGFNSARFAEAIDPLRRAEKLFSEECTGATWELTTTRIFDLYNLEWMGEWRQLSVRSPQLVGDALSRGDLYTASMVGCVIEPVVHLVAGDGEAARAAVEDALARWAQGGFFQMTVMAIHSRAWIHVYSDDGAAGLELLRDQWPALQRHLYLRVEWWRVLFLDARAKCALAAAARLPELTHLVAAAERDIALLDREQLPMARVHAASSRAGVACLRRDLERTVFWLEQTLRLANSLSMWSVAAAAQRSLAIQMQNQKMREDAETRMREQGIADVVAMTRLHCPGCPGSRPPRRDRSQIDIV